MFDLARRRDLESIADDLQQVMVYLMGLDAKLEELLSRTDFDDGEEEETGD